MHDRDVVPDRRVVHEVARREVVGAVHDHVPPGLEDPVDGLGRQALAERHDLDVRVQRLDPAPRRVGLRLAERVGRVRDLALEVRLVDDVRVNDSEPPDARRSQVEGGRRAQPTCADEQYPRVEQLQLALLADLGDQEVPAVPRLPRRAERARKLRREAVSLPIGVAAGQRDRAFVAELGECLRGEGRAVAGGAVEDHRARAVWGRLLDPGFQVAPRHVHRAGDPALLPLVALAHVDEERALVEQRLDTRGVGLLDLGLGRLKQVAVGAHGFRLYSDSVVPPRLASVES